MNSNPFTKQYVKQRTKELIGRRGYTNAYKIAKEMSKEFNVHIRTAYKYIQWAREEILKDTKRSADDHISDCLATIEEIICNSTSDKDRLAAVQLKCKILGLLKPTLVEIKKEPLIDIVAQQKFLSE